MYETHSPHQHCEHVSSSEVYDMLTAHTFDCRYMWQTRYMVLLWSAAKHTCHTTYLCFGIQLRILWTIYVSALLCCFARTSVQSLPLIKANLARLLNICCCLRNSLQLCVARCVACHICMVHASRTMFDMNTHAWVMTDFTSDALVPQSCHA